WWSRKRTAVQSRARHGCLRRATRGTPNPCHKQSLKESRSMPRVFEGELIAPAGRFALVVSRYNDSITQNLLAGAVATLTEHGVRDDAMDVAYVPGAFEIPLAAERLATSGRYVAVICLGAVIRGETTHDQHINRAVSMSLCEIGLHSGVPVLFG